MREWLESNFNSYDGLSLFYRYRKPIKTTQNTLIFLHRGHEHSRRIVPFADKLSTDDCWCFSFDLRGHGLSEGPRAWAPDFDSWVKDLNSFMGHIYQTYGISAKDTVLVANSVGSVMAVNWILNYGSNLKGCILGAPAFSIKLYIPLALLWLRFLSKISKRQFVTSYVRSSLLTRDAKEAQAYDDDPLITKKIGVNLLVTLFDAYKNCSRRLQDFEVPVLLFTAQNDYIVHNRMHADFIARISSPFKRQIVLNGFRHAVFHEIEQHKLLDPSRQFIEDLFWNDKKQLPAIIPEPRAHTVKEFEKLQQKGSALKQLYYILFRYLLTKIGKWAGGVSIGLKYGFDSGVSLDYVYQNQVSGTNGLGRIFDRIYLNSVGWRCIRTRKTHLKNTLIAITKIINAQGYEPVVYDLASGPGRYLFETQKEIPFSMRIFLNDMDVTSIEHARLIAAQFNADNVTFKNKNAFDDACESDFSKRPNIIIISGLFELYENNYHVHKVLGNMYTLLDDGGYLIYTGQPWHPQLELIGRILNNRQGQRWIMRRRVQSEIDELIGSAGFSKLSTESDDLGIFTVSCAQKT